MVKPIYSDLYETTAKETLFITNLSLFFSLVNYNIAILTYHCNYLQLFMFKNGKSKIIYKN